MAQSMMNTLENNLNLKYKIKDNYQKIKDIPCDLKYGDYESTPTPRMSVVIPTFGRPELLKNTILAYKHTIYKD